MPAAHRSGGKCALSAGPAGLGAALGVSVSIMKLTAAPEVRYVHSLAVTARAVNFYVISTKNFYGATAVNN